MISNSFNFEFLKVVSINMIAILMMSAKLASLGLLKIKVFWKKAYDVIFSVHDVINKILSHDSNYNIDMVMCPLFGNSSISMREVFITSIFLGFDEKNNFCEGCCWFKFNNSGLTYMALKFYTSVAKRFKLKVRKFQG